MTKIILEGHMIVPEPDLSDVKAALPDHIDLTLAEPGCEVFQVKQDAQRPTRFHVYEEFESQETFEAHFDRISGTLWESVTKNAQRFYNVSKDY